MPRTGNKWDDNDGDDDDDDGDDGMTLKVMTA